MKKGRTTTLLGLVGALAVLGAALVVGWKPILARWYLRQLESESAARRSSAAWWLGALRYEPSIPFLLEAVQGQRIREDAGTRALSAIGKPAVPALIQALREGNPQVRRVATESLLGVQPDKYREIGEHLRELLVPGEVPRAIRALANEFPPSEEAMAALTGSVMDVEFRWNYVAAEALGEIGPPAASALPYLIRVLKENRGGCGGPAALALAGIGFRQPQEVVPALMDALVNRLSTSRSDRYRPRVIEALGRLGPHAKAAIPALIEVLRNPEEAVPDRAAAAGALMVMARGDRRLVAPCIEALRSGDTFLMSWTNSVLPGIGRDAVKPLLETLDPKYGYAQWFAIRSLGEIGSRAAAAVPSLLAFLDGADRRKRGAAIEALGRIATPEALSRLRALRNAPDRDLAARASIALEGVDAPHASLVEKTARRSVADFLKAVKNRESLQPFLSLEALAKIESGANEATPILLEVLEAARRRQIDGMSQLEADIIDLLGRIGEPRDLVLPVLKEASQSGDLLIASRASFPLWKMGDVPGDRLIRVLVKLLEQPVTIAGFRGGGHLPHQRCEAAELLAEMGPAARSAVPAVRRALWDPEQEFRAHVAFALLRIEGDSALGEAVGAMIEALADRPHSDMGSQELARRAVSACLSRLGARVVPFLIPHLDDEDEEVRMGLIEALEALGPAAAAARAALGARLDDPYPRVRELAARALRAIGS